jgi:hypothetical protein
VSLISDLTSDGIAVWRAIVETGSRPNSRYEERSIPPVSAQKRCGKDMPGGWPIRAVSRSSPTKPERRRGYRASFARISIASAGVAATEHP